MQLYVFNEDLELCGVIESFEYLRWTRRYSNCGSFELKAIATPENISLLSIGAFLWKSDDEEIGIIEHLQISMNENEYIAVNGRFSLSLLSRRIIWSTETLKSTLSSSVGQLLNNHLINPSNADRKISLISYVNDGISDLVNTQISYKNLMDAVTELCESADCGIKAAFDPNLKTLVIRLYKGELSQAVFANEYENITEQAYTHSEINFANVALIGGEGEGSQRIFKVVGDDKKLLRREIFVDAKDLNSEELGSAYNSALLFRGQTKLNELKPVHSFDAQINIYGNLVYKTDFDLGSIVKVISKKWGTTLTARITEIEENFDSSGQSLNIVFGKGLLSLSQKLKGAI